MSANMTNRIGITATPDVAAAWPPVDRPILGADLEEFRQRQKASLNLMELAFSIPSRRTWYKLISKEVAEGEEKPRAEMPVSLSIGLLLRFFTRHPQFLPMAITESAEVMRNRLQLSPGAFGLLSGRREISVRQWAVDREPQRMVMNILWIVTVLQERMTGVVDSVKAEETLADLINCALIEWTVRGEMPSGRLGELTSEHPQVIELLSLISPEHVPIALGSEVTENVLALLRDAREEREQAAAGGLTKHSRRSTKDARERRLAARTVKGMSDSFSLDDLQ